VRIGVMLCQSAVEEVAQIKSTLQELGISVEDAISLDLLTSKEKAILRLSELQKTNPINNQLVFG
jgi:hypothetical protein